MDEIELGDKVKCNVTGFVGVAIAKTEFLNGCIQYTVVPKVDKKNTIQDEVMIDQQSLQVIGTKKEKVVKSSNGGAMRLGFKQRGY